LNTKTGFILIIVLYLLYSSAAHAQTGVSLHGTVTDTTKIGIPGANVRLVAGKDTLSSSTDSLGKFVFRGIRSADISLLVRSIGYLSLSKDYTLKAGENDQVLPVIQLRSSSKQLDEVVIKAKIVPMRLMKDTMEFNANAYTVRENDNVDDLLKQLPGIEVDNDGNVTTAGKAMTKLRVNGKDFFTGNVKDFISRLPAGIVDKLQVIDDYGDKASFTGIKTGEPQKMLNLVLKDKSNRGTFGNVVASAGTNDRYSLNANGNIWRDAKQLGFNANGNNTNTGAGVNTSTNLGVNYRDKIGKKLLINGNYSYGRNKSDLDQQSFIQTINSLGTIYNESDNETHSKGNTHNFELGLQSTDIENFVSGSIRGSLGNSVSNALTSSKQTGVIHQDLINGNNSNQRSPNLNADFNMARKFKKSGRMISIGITAGNNLSNNTQDQDNRIGYYDPETNLPVKDSIRNQLVDTRNTTRNVNASFTYTEPLGNPKDSLSKKGLDFTYLFSLTHTNNGLETNVNDEAGIPRRVDSLSNKYSSSFMTQTIGVTYRYTSKELNYSAGINGQPNLLTGAYEGRADKVNRSGFNFSPVARIDYKPSLRTVFSIYYNGTSALPDFNQLQPVPDTRNLQNVIIGNPDLKAAFNHTLDLSYRSTDPGNGSTLQVGIRGTAVQDQVVSNTILIRDTLNSLKQETRYLNTSGYYNFGSNYYWSLPISKKKYNLEVRGSMNYSHQVSFSDDIKNYGKGIGFNQTVSMRMNQKWLMLHTSASYNYKSNIYSLASANSNIVQTWLFNLEARTFILKSLTAGVNSSKTINEGYSLPGSDPLLIGGFVEKTFFKDRRAGIKIEGNDLLNQGNSLNRTVSDNSITESKSNQVTRYFLLSFNWKLQNFPGMHGFKARERRDM
jgi:hypothetical protein